MPGFASDSMIDTLKTDLNKLRPIYVRINRLKDQIEEERANHPSLTVANAAEAEFKKMDDAANRMSSRTTKEEPYKLARKALTAFISKKLMDKRETALKAALAAAKAWTVTVNGRTDSWVNSHAAGSQFDTLQNKIKRDGLAADGLRHISGNVYDWHVPGAGNYRVVGTANKPTHQFAFEGVYRHAGGGGKEHVDGDTVSGY